MGELEPRCQILVEYAKWTALSAVRVPRSPIKAREPVYQLLGGVAFSRVLNPSLGPISCEDFDPWHQVQTEDLCTRAKPMLSVGWGAKLINVYLKTTAYVGDLGREGLRDVLHPPVDNRLKNGLARHFRRNHPEIWRKQIRAAVKFRSITAIAKYEEYQRIIDGFRVAAEVLGCSLFEVEQLWS